MGVPPDSPRTTNPYTFRSSPPDLDRLREWAEWNDQDPYSTGGPAEEAARFLLSLVESGGRLVVRQPCLHGFNEGHWATPERWCNEAGSLSVVWPREEK